MAKKKNKTSITLSNQELIPSVIGVIDDKEKSNWPLIILFILLIGFIVALPTITAYISGEKDITTLTNPGGRTDSGTSNEPVVELKYYVLSDTVNIGGMSFQDFALRDGMIHFSITNNQESKSYLLEHKLYLELYDAEKTLMQRIKMPTDSLSRGNTQTYSFEFNGASSNIVQFTLDEKTEDDYPAVRLKKEDDDTYSLTCTKGRERLEYQFDEEQKLSSIDHTVNYTSSVEGYQEAFADYRQVSSKYNSIDGVVSNIVQAGNGFTFTTMIDLTKVDFSSRTVTSTLNHEAYYAGGTFGKVVYFELSAMNYKCNI